MQQTFYLSLLAHLFGKASNSSHGLELIDQAVDVIQRYEEHWFEAEIYRCRGELYLQIGQEQSAEQAFRCSLAVAQQQEARMLELRAATRLGKLLVTTGQKDRAHEILAPLYQWFHEGMDIPDLADARILLYG